MFVIGIAFVTLLILVFGFGYVGVMMFDPFVSGLLTVGGIKYGVLLNGVVYVIAGLSFLIAVGQGKYNDELWRVLVGARLTAVQMNLMLHETAYAINHFCSQQIELQTGVGWPLGEPVLPPPDFDEYPIRLAQVRREQDRILRRDIKRAKKEHWRLVGILDALSLGGYHPNKNSFKPYVSCLATPCGSDHSITHEVWTDRFATKEKREQEIA